MAKSKTKSPASESQENSGRKYSISEIFRYRVLLPMYAAAENGQLTSEQQTLLDCVSDEASKNQDDLREGIKFLSAILMECDDEDHRFEAHALLFAISNLIEDYHLIEADASFVLTNNLKALCNGSLPTRTTKKKLTKVAGVTA